MQRNDPELDPLQERKKNIYLFIKKKNKSTRWSWTCLDSMSLTFQTFLVPGTITAINLNSFKQRTFNPRKRVLVKICSSPSCFLLIIYLLMVKEFYFNEKKTKIEVRMGGNLCRGNGKESGEWKEGQVMSVFRFWDEQMEKATTPPSSHRPFLLQALSVFPSVHSH